MNRDKVNQILKVLIEFTFENNQLSSAKEIYEYLSKYKVDQNADKNINDIRNHLVSFVNDKIYNSLKDEGSNQINRQLIKDQVSSNGTINFTHLNVAFKGNIECPPRDVIKLYIPLMLNNMENNARKIYEFMFENKINFQTKIAGTNRNDLFVVRVDNKVDALKIIDFCKNEIKEDEIGLCNPFLPTKDKIGIARDTNGNSYNYFLAENISSFINESYQNKNKSVNLLTFIKYMQLKDNAYNCDENKKGSTEHYQIKELVGGLKDVNNNSSPFNRYKDKIEFTYKHDLFANHKRYLDTNGNYQYKNLSNGKMVIYQSKEWFELQAMNFMAKIYSKKYMREPTKNFQLNEAFISKCLEQIDYIQDKIARIDSYNFDDDKLERLYPDFIAYLAIAERDAGLNRAVKLSKTMSTLVIKQLEDNMIEFNNAIIEYNIPLIKVDGATIAIKRISDDKVNNLCNISVFKNGKLTRYNNVFIDLNDKLLFYDSDHKDEASAYRAWVGNILSDLDRNKRMMNERNGYFGKLEFEPGRGFVKYLNPQYISKISDLKSSNQLPDSYQEEIIR